MATIPAVLLRLRRARRQTRAPPESGQFEAYRPAYEEILVAAEELAGEEAVDEIAEWATEWTERERQLPEPERMRARAREFVEEREIEIPTASALS